MRVRTRKCETDRQRK